VLFSVKIVLLHRGAPGERARIYRLPTEAYARREPLAHKIRDGWTRLLESHEKYEISKLRYRKKYPNKDGMDGCGGQESVSNEQKPRLRKLEPGASRHHRAVLLPHTRPPPPKPPLQPGHEGYPSVPGEEDLIGFMTSGNYNLKEGRGTGIAGLSFARVFNEWIDSIGESSGAVSRICIVREVGETVGRLARWEII